MVFLTSTGKKLAVVIGINYKGTNAELRGCINDANNMCSFLKTKINLTDNDIILLTDETQLKPTRSNILNTLSSVIDKVKVESIETILLSYAGHGSYTIDYNKDEKISEGDANGKDECLVPLDYSTKGLITDDELFALFIKRIPKNCTLVSIMDCCHSGTILDLPYVYRCTNNGIIEEHGTYFDDMSKIIKISGCRDNQTSADAYINGSYQGAMTNTFLKILNDNNYNVSCRQLISRMKTYINNNGYQQIPTLAFSRKEYLDELFIGNEIKETNITIVLNGDQWCDTETTWNLYNLTKNQFIFSENRLFSQKNTKVQLDLALDYGRYLLIFYDTYGDGGVNGFVYNKKTQKSILDYNFDSGSQKSFEFSFLESEQSQIVIKQIEINIFTDYYGASESLWNIKKSDGSKIFSSDKTFGSSFEVQNEVVSLKEGTYKLVLIDKYGDGGLSGNIKISGKEILVFDWINKDWKTVDGKYIEYEFTI